MPRDIENPMVEKNLQNVWTLQTCVGSLSQHVKLCQDPLGWASRNGCVGHLKVGVYPEYLAIIGAPLPGLRGYNPQELRFHDGWELHALKRMPLNPKSSQMPRPSQPFLLEEDGSRSFCLHLN